MAGIPRRLRARCRLTAQLLAVAAFAGAMLSEAAKAGPIANDPVVFQLDGDFFTPAAGSEVKTWDFPVSNDKVFTKVVVELDVTPAGWWAVNPDGLHPQALEADDAIPPNPPKIDPARDILVRRSLGQCLEYADRMDLASLTPRTGVAGVASTGYCLFNPGVEYLAFIPAGGPFTLDLSAASGALALEWLNAETGETHNGGAITGGESRQSREGHGPPYSTVSCFCFGERLGEN